MEKISTTTKLCKGVCGLYLDTSLFSSEKRNRDGKHSYCENCVKSQAAKRYKQNKDKILLQTRKYQQTHKKETKQQKQEYYKENKEAILRRNKRYREENKEAANQRNATYRKEHEEEIKAYARLYREEHKDKTREYQREYQKKKLSTDLNYRMMQNRRRRRREVLKGFKKTHAINDLGCATPQWFDYLESLFDESMTWANYGPAWHIDEIIPCSAWEQSDPIERKCCWHYLNSRPLEKMMNITRPHGKNYDYTKEKLEFMEYMQHLGII